LTVCISSKGNESNVRKHVRHNVNILYDIYMRFHARYISMYMWLNGIERLYIITAGLHMIFFRMLYKKFHAICINMYM
jgi:hypothetical protein